VIIKVVILVMFVTGMHSSHNTQEFKEFHLLPSAQPIQRCDYFVTERDHTNLS
jgi:hypothetical protein